MLHQENNDNNTNIPLPRLQLIPRPTRAIPQLSSFGSKIHPVHKIPTKANPQLVVTSNFEDSQKNVLSKVIQLPSKKSKHVKVSSKSNHSIQKGKGDDEAKVYQKDYLHIANLYQQQRKYHDVLCKEKCILCNKNQVTHAFFPCNHRCVCHSCIDTRNIQEIHTLDVLKVPKIEEIHTTCPLCLLPIKKIFLMNNGQEIEDYYDWVDEVKPILSETFLKKFNHSRFALQKVFIDDVELVRQLELRKKQREIYYRKKLRYVSQYCLIC